MYLINEKILTLMEFNQLKKSVKYDGMFADL